MNLAEFHFINIVKWLTVGKLVLQVTQLIIWLPSLYLMSQFYIWWWSSIHFVEGWVCIAVSSHLRLVLRGLGSYIGRAVATSMAGLVSTGPFLGPPNFLAHSTVGGTTSRPIGSYVFSCQASKYDCICKSWKWLFLTSSIIKLVHIYTVILKKKVYLCRKLYTDLSAICE